MANRKSTLLLRDSVNVGLMVLSLVGRLAQNSRDRRANFSRLTNQSEINGAIAAIQKQSDGHE
ncbi:hypothetical protein [Myxacorys almedinensis]|uniref:Uncharacterized protein n=1 Tax=Myxacorys almedinensis A TaxID=2690445 RepID=A0A8J7Z685_9CYAN|nr:hypothetical protein [Myxacorys almedinensis]NDJ16230.1 hypothetical protein [Myxacorys almedinensis A]